MMGTVDRETSAQLLLIFLCDLRDLCAMLSPFRAFLKRFRRYLTQHDGCLLKMVQAIGFIE
jgi:hypothetical protein